LFAVGEFWVLKRRPALAAMFSNRIVPELLDVCPEAFDRSEGGVHATVETRLIVRIRVKKRMLSKSAEWFARADVSAIRCFEDDIPL
jgi:hypothetical protein